MGRTCLCSLYRCIRADWCRSVISEAFIGGLYRFGVVYQWIMRGLRNIFAGVLFAVPKNLCNFANRNKTHNANELKHRKLETKTTYQEKHYLLNLVLETSTTSNHPGVKQVCSRHRRGLYSYIWMVGSRRPQEQINRVGPRFLCAYKNVPHSRQSVFPLQ